jgi:serine/threonine protein kinase
MTEPPATVGRYHVERLIAHGGMGSVYLARDPAIDRPVVIKLLKAGFDDVAARERFAREARAAGRLQHPNIVTVFDVGEHEDRPFIAMEYVPGETLWQLIRRSGVIRVWEKLAILEDLCSGLHYAHGLGIVHRDIKPANVMVDESGMVKILDFGVARAGAGPITRVGDVVGTLNYMSPEQLSGRPVDHRTDVYSVGALASELFSHQMAFPGTVDTGVLHKILNSSPVPIEALVPAIDPDIVAIIERAMARDLDARYPHLEELGQDVAVVRVRLLETAADVDEPTDPEAETRVDSGRVASGSQARPSARGSSTLSRATRSATPRSAPVVSRQPRSKGTLLLGVGCALLAGALIATVVMFNRSPSVSPAVQTDSPAREQPPQQRPAPVETPNIPADRPAAAGNAPLEEQLSAARDMTRRQMAAGERQGALDALIRGLALDTEDPALNALAQDLAIAARRTAIEARTAASERGANPKSSAEFRSGQGQESAADGFVRAGDRVRGIRTFWAAAALYNKARGVAGQPSVPAPLPTPAAPAIADPVEPSSAKPPSPEISVVPRESLERPPAAANAPAPSPSSAPPAPSPPPPASVPEVRPTPRDSSADTGAADLSAIRETLRRYTLAYQSLSSAAVGQVMRSLTAEQLRSLDRDFSNYRRYGVDIRDERIAVEGMTATVTCQVVRSFETKTGVTGSNAVASVFHLRRSGSVWTIEHLESR